MQGDKDGGHISKGKNKIKTAFITYYCPVRGASPGSAYSQKKLLYGTKIYRKIYSLSKAIIWIQSEDIDR